MSTVVIVESPGKTKKIEKILGAGHQVYASVGHIRDLPSNKMGIEGPDYQMQYVPTDRGKTVISKLKQAIKGADRIVIATDPDREGEAIAWHIQDALKIKDYDRVTFTAITAEKIKQAMAAPTQIDMPRVRAQEARRALDRLVGYGVSPVISQKLGGRLSAGRVQSPAVRLVVDREREISSFKSTEHYSAVLFFGEGDQQWRAELVTKPHIAEGKFLLNKDLAESAAASRETTVAAYEDEIKSKAPQCPFTTSLLQQVAGSRLKYKPKKTMDLAQKLYEQGVITYHRTDSRNLDAQGIAEIRAYADDQGLELPAEPRTWKEKEGSQEGHEAIRPTSIADTEAGDTADEKALYQLIWQRAVASQLAAADYATRTVELSAGDFMYRATGSKLEKLGWQAVYKDDDKKEAANPVPILAVGQALTATNGQLLTKKTQPPRRFTEPTLVKELEDQGIGRPSTYAAIMENIGGRGYIEGDKKGYLSPTKTGEAIRDALVGHFIFAELDYTRDMENRLDLIAEDKDDFLSVIQGADEALQAELEKFGATQSQALHPCPDCGKALVKINGSKGVFWGCSGYRDNTCSVTLPDDNGAPGERKKAEISTEFLCPECNAGMVRIEGKYGAFWGCSNFSGDDGCKTKLPDENGKPGKAPPKREISKYPCPRCNYKLERYKGTKNGKDYDFYGCVDRKTCKATFVTASNGLPDFVEEEGFKHNAVADPSKLV